MPLLTVFMHRCFLVYVNGTLQVVVVITIIIITRHCSSIQVAMVYVNLWDYVL